MAKCCCECFACGLCSRMPDAPGVPPVPRPTYVAYGWETMERHVKVDPRRWPLLDRAVRGGVRVAYSPTVEWTVDPSATSATSATPGKSLEFNRTQIFRRRVHSSERPSTALCSMMDEIETALRSSTPRDIHTDGFQTMKSVPLLLGRWPRKQDTLKLAILHDLVFTSDSVLNRHEWFFEATVVAMNGGPDQ